MTLTKSLRCRAQTRPSPPLLPGPQITSTEGLAFTREVSGYACRKTMTRQFYTAQHHSFSLQQIGTRNQFIPLQVRFCHSLIHKPSLSMSENIFESSSRHETWTFSRHNEMPDQQLTLAMAVAQLSPASSISWSTLKPYSLKSSSSMCWASSCLSSINSSGYSL